MTNRPGSSRLLLDFLHADSLGRFLLAFVNPRQANWKHRQVRTLRPFEDWSVHDKLSIRSRANWLSGVTVGKKDVTANRKGARGWERGDEENHFIPSAPACVCVCVCVCVTVCVCVCVKYTLLLRFCVGLVKCSVRTFANEILHHRNDCYY